MGPLGHAELKVRLMGRFGKNVRGGDFVILTYLGGLLPLFVHIPSGASSYLSVVERIKELVSCIPT